MSSSLSLLSRTNHHYLSFCNYIEKPAGYYQHYPFVVLRATAKMANQPSWYSGLTELTIVPGEYYYIVRMISFFFVRGIV